MSLLSKGLSRVFSNTTVQKTECRRTDAFKLRTLESPLDFKDIKPVNPKGNQSGMFIGMIDAEAPILWPPGANSSLVGKDPDSGKDCRQEEKGTVEHKMARCITDSVEKTLMMEKIEGKRRRG